MNQDAIKFIQDHVADQAMSHSNEDVEICKILMWIQEAFISYNLREYQEIERLRDMGFRTFKEWEEIKNAVDND